MKIKNIEVDFDFLDANDVERLEKATQKLVDKTEEYKEKEISMSEEIRLECEIIENFLDEVFGNGISEKLFNGKQNLKEHVDVFQDIMNEKIKYNKDIEAMYQRYQPNRDTRRNGKYKHTSR